jgi:mannosyltransferase
VRPALAVVLALAAALRLAGLGHESFWYDEAVTHFNVRLPLPEIVGGVIARDVSPPLYFLLLALWAKVFGTSEAALRAPSALGGLAAVVLVHHAARRLAGERVALLAAALMAISPVSVRFAQEARMYGLMVPLAAAALALLARELDRPAPRAWLPLALVNLALAYTHVFGLFAPALAFVAVWRALGFADARRFALVQAPLLALFVPWVGVMADQARARSGAFWIGAPDLGSVHFLAFTFSGGSPFPSGPWVTLAGRALVRLAYVIALAGGIAAWRVRASDPRPWRVVRFCLAGLALPVAIAFAVSRLATPVFVDRYFLFLAPLYWILLAQAAALLPGRRAWLVVGAIAALQAPILADLHARPHKEQWREAAAIVRAHPEPADLIVDTGGMMNLIAYLGASDPPPKTSTLVASFPQRHLTAGELLERVGSARRVWVFYSRYCPDPEGYRRGLATRFDEVARHELHGVTVALYRRR